MLLLILQTIYFFLPAGFANMAPVLFQRWFTVLAIPLDCGLKINGRRLFGEHKTVRGLFCGFFLGTCIAYFQSLHIVPSLEIIDYTSWLLLGLLQSGGALLGDVLKSFFKRQMGIAPGQPWIPFDQLDFVIGAIILTRVAFVIPLNIIILSLLLVPLLHIATNRLGYILKIRKTPW